MSIWRKKALELFPERNHGLDKFQDPTNSIYLVFRCLLDDLDKAVNTEDWSTVSKIFEYVNWCFDQGERAPDLLNAVACSFLEHLGDKDERAKLIPRWVRPDIFEVMLDEFEKRRESERIGSFMDLVNEYNKSNNKDFKGNGLRFGS